MRHANHALIHARLSPRAQSTPQPSRCIDSPPSIENRLWPLKTNIQERLKTIRFNHVLQNAAAHSGFQRPTDSRTTPNRSCSHLRSSGSSMCMYWAPNVPAYVDTKPVDQRTQSDHASESARMERAIQIQIVGRASTVPDPDAADECCPTDRGIETRCPRSRQAWISFATAACFIGSALTTEAVA